MKTTPDAPSESALAVIGRAIAESEVNRDKCKITSMERLPNVSTEVQKP